MGDRHDITALNIRNYIAETYPDHTYDSNLLRFALDRSAACNTLMKTGNFFQLTAKGEQALLNFQESFARGVPTVGRKKKPKTHVSARVNQLVHEAFQVEMTSNALFLLCFCEIDICIDYRCLFLEMEVSTWRALLLTR